MKKTIIALYATIFTLNAIAITSLPSVVLAQTPSQPTPCTADSAAICNPLHAQSVTTVLTDIVNIAIPIGAVIAVLAFIFVGFKFIIAQGNPEEIKKAWRMLMYVIIGTAILLGAKLIITIIEGTLSSAGVVQPGLLPNL